MVTIKSNLTKHKDLQAMINSYLVNSEVTKCKPYNPGSNNRTIRTGKSGQDRYSRQYSTRSNSITRSCYRTNREDTSVQEEAVQDTSAEQ